MVDVISFFDSILIFFLQSITEFMPGFALFSNHPPALLPSEMVARWVT
jgi:hypothetical protein